MPYDVVDRLIPVQPGAGSTASNPPVAVEWSCECIIGPFAHVGSGVAIHRGWPYVAFAVHDLNEVCGEGRQYRCPPTACRADTAATQAVA